jgi:tRNA(Arg) A34 adenosine deaminase TadA
LCFCQKQSSYCDWKKSNECSSQCINIFIFNYRLLQGTRHAEFEAIDYILSLRSPNQSLADYMQVFKEITVYVTVEPCIMCASMLRQLQIKKVHFGCGNDKFGGNGTVLDLHIELKSYLKS